MTDDDLKRQAAEAALSLVEPGMRLGLGTGSTADHFIRGLGARVRGGLQVVGVPTSERSARLAAAEGIPLADFDAEPVLDLDIDGADELDRSLRLIKGGGGALLREKIVAAASRQMVVIADGSKLVDRLGDFPLPIEVVEFGLGATTRAIAGLAGRLGLAVKLNLRQTDAGKPYLTDGGHRIIDASFGHIPDPEALAGALGSVPGVVEHGLFIGLATAAVVARQGGVEWVRR